MPYSMVSSLEFMAITYLIFLCDKDKSVGFTTVVFDMNTKKRKGIAGHEGLARKCLVENCLHFTTLGVCEKHGSFGTRKRLKTQHDTPKRAHTQPKYTHTTSGYHNRGIDSRYVSEQHVNMAVRPSQKAVCFKESRQMLRQSITSQTLLPEEVVGIIAAYSDGIIGIYGTRSQDIVLTMHRTAVLLSRMSAVRNVRKVCTSSEDCVMLRYDNSICSIDDKGTYTPIVSEGVKDIVTCGEDIIILYHSGQVEVFTEGELKKVPLQEDIHITRIQEYTPSTTYEWEDVLKTASVFVAVSLDTKGYEMLHVVSVDQVLHSESSGGKVRTLHHGRDSHGATVFVIINDVGGVVPLSARHKTHYQQVEHDLNSTVVDVCINNVGVTALKATGDVIIWGPGILPYKISNRKITHIASTATFWGGLTEDHRIVLWNATRYTVFDSILLHGDIQYLYASANFMYGFTNNGHYCIYTDIFTSHTSMYTLATGGQPYSIHPSWDGFSVIGTELGHILSISLVEDDLTVSRFPLTVRSGVRQIYSTTHLHVALLEDRTIVEWGVGNTSTTGRTTSSVAQQLNDVISIYPIANRRFAATTATGQIVIWGRRGVSGQYIEDVIHGVS